LIVRKLDGSVETAGGKVIYFSLERFQREICQGGHCFLCGASPGSVEFNDEHILPNWLLSEFGLFRRTIGLPNDRPYKYGRYKVPCCVSCNTRLGRELEDPISRLFRGGFSAVAEHVEKRGTQLLYSWLSLVFLKSHLKDETLPYHLDARDGTERIAHLYDWAEFHHAHSVARAFLSGCSVDPTAVGSLLIANTETAEHYEHFDYVDLFAPQAVLLRFRDIGLVAVLDDGCGCTSYLQRMLRKLGAPISPVQLRELLAHFAYTNLKLAERPRFLTDFTKVPCEIRGVIPKQVDIADHEPPEYGRILYRCVKEFLDHMVDDNMEVVREEVKAGIRSWLFDKNGDFNRHSFEPIP